MEIEKQLNKDFEALPFELKLALLKLASGYEEAEGTAWPSDNVKSAYIVASESHRLVRVCKAHNYNFGNFQSVARQAVVTGAAAVRFLISTID